MTFNEILEQAIDMLQRRGRVSYGALKRQFDLDDEYLADLKIELTEVLKVAADKDGKMLVWNGDGRPAAPSMNTPPVSPPPASYTPSHLAERIRAEQAALEARGETDGERKTITALFADLKGSTALIEDLDPEEARTIIDPALQIMMDAVHRYEGYVAQVLGDGIFALFGAPIAHEDHPQRALYAALRMQEDMRRYGDQVRLKHGVPLVMRVGVNTGEVVVRSIRKDDLHTDYVPVGHSTNLAARMEQMATPGSILITEYTRKLVEGYFELKALGVAEIKGVEAPLNVYEVLGAGPLRTKLQVAARRGLTRFVGRQSELEQMQRALTQAKAGHGQIVGVMGEPGLGKSRLFHEFKLTSQSGCLVLEAYSVSHGKATAYLPLIELLKSYFDIQPQDDEHKRREKVAGKVVILDRTLEEILPYLFALLGIEEQPSPLHQMDPQIRRRPTFEVLKRLFFRESLQQPLMLIFEDLHWIDSETQEFLDVLSESVASTQVLLLVNYRPEYRHEWGQKTYYTQLRLAPLGQDEAEELLTFLLGNDTRIKSLKQLILAKTEGTPFFMEEVVQTLAEEGVLSGERGSYRLEKSPTALHISPTVQGVLAARIDRLMPDEKALLQQLAVIGREFPVSLLRQVITQSEEELYRLLASLQRKEFLYEQPAFPEVEYSFKHALTQEVAYGAVLIERRKTLHEQTAQAIEDLYRANLDDHYSELAHHYSRSSNTQKAIEYLQCAGHQAVQRSAHAEAATHFITALELLQTLADTPERTQQELTLQLALALPLMVTKGFATPEVGAVHTRALALCQQLGETSQLFRTLWSALLFYFTRAELQTAREVAQRLMALAQHVQDSLLLLEAHYGLGTVLSYLGEGVAARAHLEQVLDLYDPGQQGAGIARVGADLGVITFSYLANVLWWLGYPDQARVRSRAAQPLAQEMAHPPTTAGVWIWETRFEQFLRDARATQQRAEAVITLCNEQGFAELATWVVVPQGWALAMQGQVDEGINQIRQGLAAARAKGDEVWRPYSLALLAEAYREAGREEEGLTALAEALAGVDSTGERMYEAELYRLKGELTLQVHGQNLESEAEASFQKALTVARRQEAKSWELRAATSLARLWQQQGKRIEARDLLAAVYNWFTEGFETKDLQEAKALLEELT